MGEHALERHAELERLDSIVIGAGHNGLTCAAYLAKAGQRVVVLEAGDAAGGLAATREFAPGFIAAPAHSISHFSAKVVKDLDLPAHGFRPASAAMPTIGLAVNGEHVTATGASLDGASADDAEAYSRYCRLLHRFADALEPSWMKTMPSLGSRSMADLLTFAGIGLKLRRLGKADMREFLRIASLPMRDLADEYFDSDLVKAMLCWDGLIGGRMAPRSPNGAVLALLYRMSGEMHGAHTIPAGGVNGLVGALQAAATAAGADVRLSTEVRRIAVDASADGIKAVGVRLADGEEITADRIISAADPKTTFLKLLGVEYLDIGLTNRIGRLRCNGLVAKLHLALDGAPEFTGLESPDGRMIIAPTMDAIEFAFDDAKYGECSREPVMEVCVPSLHDPALAPDGKHVLSAHVMYVPYKHKDGWSDASRDAACNLAIDTLASYAPGIREQILHQEFLTPADLERKYRVTGGHWHHTEFAMDQMLMMRPTYGAAQYSTPVPGLFLCGAGSHPAGDLVGAAGHNAAQEILR